MLSDRVDLKDLSERLGYRDSRLKAVKRWCASNALTVYKTGRQSYVYRDQLDQILRHKESQHRTAVIINPKLTAMKNKISIPKSKKFESLFMTCNTCKRNYSSDDAVTCKHELKYKARVSVKVNGKYTNKSKVLDATDYMTAVLELAEYKNSLNLTSNDQGGEMSPVGMTPVNFIPAHLPLYEKPIDMYRFNPKLTISDCIKSYMDYLNNVGVPAHLQKVRSKHNNDEASIILNKIFVGALKANNISDQTAFTDINENMIGLVYTYCQKYSNKYFNKIFGRLTTWADYTIEKFNLHFKNPFEKVTRKKVVTNVETISGREFEKLLAIVTPDRGRVTFEGGKRNYETKNRYRPWLKTAFKLGVMMGGRRDEIVYVRWSHIVWQNNQPHHFKIENHKVNRAKGFIKPEEKVYATIPVTAELLAYLYELGLEKHKDSNDYILAPDEDATRETIKDVMSKGFAHYWQQLNTGKTLQFKNLRKTFKTAAIHQFGSRALAFWGGSDMNMELKHYVDQAAVNDAVNSMRVLR